MPELPEVQTLVDDLRASSLIGQTIKDVQVRWPRIVAEPTLELFCRQLAGQRVSDIQRRAKYLVFSLGSGQSLLVHLRMTGKFAFASPKDALEAHHHVLLTFGDERQLRYHDTRKFGRFSLVQSAEEALRHLGLEPLSAEFTPEALEQRLRGRRTPLKAFLLDQRQVAGIGNIYADEALWGAGLHPATPAGSLSQEQVHFLYSSIIEALQRGLRNMGTTLGNSQANFYSVAGRRGRNEDELRVFRRTGLPCPRCGQAIERTVLAQRSTHYCLRCQQNGKRT
ncbi:bifunctional DNA-formamidopyrimidine glycosylase/DNA-(apurinic or apyrimidinic site) lyase [Desulfurispira natronophila]|uniref:Formamidopyrimidine-DNA glycosylase n=1 Tax=Desulfurispira natronophila TaxID=682562 RepID=A0A7W7Y263_9BACT|nr:bifunctional DNA-formamidopyrimidine glycosylase/DNA-(apurinic or apyrimidinic site) lyase [Desulfurispira natronophila]MBB5020705.1 formamidopyrimidine-DNA glycosylase [Desulfurispira natronophila]